MAGDAELQLGIPAGRQPTSRIAELYGCDPKLYRDSRKRIEAARLCPFRNTVCDVTANRNRVAQLNFNHAGVAQDAGQIVAIYGNDPLPLGICSCWSKRQNETIEKPWILCPKRLLTLERPRPLIPKEVRALIDLDDGTRVGVWSELKFRRRETGSMRFFEYTFDYLLMALDEAGLPNGVPYIIEVMTSSTRGGGLSEHMADVVLGRPQRHLRNVVQSVYTPNYRQVFERMLGQFIAKSEIAEHWGGRAIWVFQDVLLDYIEQTTAFRSDDPTLQQSGNVFCEVYSLKIPEPTAGVEQHAGLHLLHHKSIRGTARAVRQTEDYTSFLGLGYAPSLDDLRKTLQAGLKRSKKLEFGSWFEFRLGEDTDPRTTEPLVQ